MWCGLWRGRRGVGRPAELGYNPECFENAPVMRESERYKLNGRCPLWVETGEPYGQIVYGGSRYWVRPDVGEKYIKRELSKEEIVSML